MSSVLNDIFQFYSVSCKNHSLSCNEFTLGKLQGLLLLELRKISAKYKILNAIMVLKLYISLILHQNYKRKHFLLVLILTNLQLNLSYSGSVERTFFLLILYFVMMTNSTCKFLHKLLQFFPIQSILVLCVPVFR